MRDDDEDDDDRDPALSFVLDMALIAAAALAGWAIGSWLYMLLTTLLS